MQLCSVHKIRIPKNTTYQYNNILRCPVGGFAKARRQRVGIALCTTGNTA